MTLISLRRVQYTHVHMCSRQRSHSIVVTQPCRRKGSGSAASAAAQCTAAVAVVVAAAVLLLLEKASQLASLHEQHGQHQQRQDGQLANSLRSTCSRMRIVASVGVRRRRARRPKGRDGVGGGLDVCSRVAWLTRASSSCLADCVSPFAMAKMTSRRRGHTTSSRCRRPLTAHHKQRSPHRRTAGARLQLVSELSIDPAVEEGRERGRRRSVRRLWRILGGRPSGNGRLADGTDDDAKMTRQSCRC